MNREMRRKERAERELKQLKADISNKVNIVYTPVKTGFSQSTHTQRRTIAELEFLKSLWGLGTEEE
jgi:hypothetical protein